MHRFIFSLISIFVIPFHGNVKADISTIESLPTKKIIQEAITDLVEDNEVFFKSKSPEHFEGFLDIQTPRTTAILCSDSRVQLDNFSGSAENDVFVIRDIGNQIPTAKGSVEYGVNVLKTPVLLIVGHSHCGAIKAARQKDLNVPPAIKKELSTLNVKKATDDKSAVILNVNQQVDMALDTFKKRIDHKELVVIGAIYDFRNDYGLGKGRLIIVNLNGDKDPTKIRESHYFDGIKAVAIGVPTP